MLSEETLWQRQLYYTPLGGQTLSKLPSRFASNYPKMLERGKDCVVLGSNNEYYIDLIAGLGAVSVGYNNTDVNRAVISQLAKGVSFSLPISLEGEVCETLSELMPEMQMWKFAKTGTQANEYAVRCARAYTGRTNVLAIGYNGCNDQFEVTGTRNAGVPTELSPTITKVPYNTSEVIHELLEGNYACLLMEPMVYEYPKEGFLKEIREVCTQTGTLLIFDEVVTGGRFETFAAYRLFKVVPDLITMGKGLANGFPLSVVGGKRDIMRTFERDDFFASGTFGGEAVSLAAALECVSILQTQLPRMVANGQRIKDTFNRLFKNKAEAKGYPTRLIFDFPTPEHKALWMQEMCHNNVLVGSANFVMASYTDVDVEVVLGAMQDTYKFMEQNWEKPSAVLEGPVPTEALKRK